MNWCIQRLDSRHDRSKFESKYPELTQYLKQQATQHSKKGLSKTYVAVETESLQLPKSIIKGYYSISNSHIPLDQLSPELANKYRYPVPIVLLARLAVDINLIGQGLGKILLVDAMKRINTMSDDVGISAIATDAKDDDAKDFYEHFGFTALQDNPYKLFIPLTTVRKTFT